VAGRRRRNRPILQGEVGGADHSFVPGVGGFLGGHLGLSFQAVPVLASLISLSLSRWIPPRCSKTLPVFK